MTTATIISTDLHLRDAILRHLDWDPEVDPSALGVNASEGIVTLTGFIDSYTGKLAAERAVRRIRGVRAVANDIVVRLANSRTDEDIARDAANVIASRQTLADTVQVVVHHAHITLTGTVEWLFQRKVAEDVVRHVRGVIGVHNHITIRPSAAQRDVQQRVIRALHHNADVDARHIEVTVIGNAVTLTGTVDSWAQSKAAAQAAAQAPGVTDVHNHIAVASTMDANRTDEIR